MLQRENAQESDAMATKRVCMYMCACVLQIEVVPLKCILYRSVRVSLICLRLMMKMQIAALYRITAVSCW